MVASPPWTELSAMAGLDETVLRASCRRRRYGRGEIVFHEGDPPGSFHLIDKGSVAIRLTTPRGDVATLDVLQSGATFGEQAIVDATPLRSATVAALEELETLSLDASSFEALRTAYPRVDRFLLMVLSARLRSTSHQLLEALFVPAEERVLRCLVRLSAMFASEPQSWIPLTQSEIASMTGVTRPTVSRVLGQAQLDGLIALKRSPIDLLDESGLRRKAGLRPSV
jgi:CRP/FNR family cyclic AMP-dependent transcriptional regulator